MKGKEQGWKNALHLESGYKLLRHLKAAMVNQNVAKS